MRCPNCPLSCQRVLRTFPSELKTITLLSSLTTNCPEWRVTMSVGRVKGALGTEVRERNWPLAENILTLCSKNNFL